MGGDRTAASPGDDDLELMLLLNTSIDQVEVHLKAVMQALQRNETRNPDPYLGILSPALFDAEDVNIYGHMAATQVKVLAVIRDGMCKQKRDEDNILRSLLRQLHQLYVDAASNPFYEGLGNASFGASVVRIVEQHAGLLSKAFQTP